jgi:soluble lytic murein transglycosylase-like protein
MRQGRQQAGEAWDGGGRQSLSPWESGRLQQRLQNLGFGMLGASRAALRAPYGVARWVGRRFSPKHRRRRRRRRLFRRIRRVVLLLPLLPLLLGGAVLSAMPTLGPPDVLAALTPALVETLAEGEVDEPTGLGGSYGMVGGIPYAEAFNATAELGIDPRLVAAVAWAESDFAEDVVSCRRNSSAGAQGIMQLMPDTARALGVDPCDPEEAIRGGARYLLQQFRRFDDWSLALAAYNAGPGNVEGCDCVPNILETQAYVPKVLAKWEEYKDQFPTEEIAGVVSPGDVVPRGGTGLYRDSHNTPTMQRVLDAVITHFGRGRGVGCFRSGDQDHGRGRACDVMMATAGQHPSGPREDYGLDRTCEMMAEAPVSQVFTMEDHGDALACWLMANARALRVQYVIWQQQIWNIDVAGGWRMMEDRGSITQNHYDHVHISVQPEP